jgi:hypothetical protein
MRRFYLGIQEPYWLPRATRPTFLSFRRIMRRVQAGRRKFPRARTHWALDSGGFTEVSKYGADAYKSWPPRIYASWVLTLMLEVGLLEWAAIQDWMCEDEMLLKTHMTVAQHQALTLRSYLTLMSINPFIPWVPVLQGYTVEDYKRHVGDYYSHGIDLSALPLVGLGSVCRRQTLTPIVGLCNWLKGQGLRVHGFGVNKTGLPELAAYLDSTDSMAWAVDAQYSEPLPGHTHVHCGYCYEFAHLWRESVDRLLARHSIEYLFVHECELLPADLGQ